MILQKRILTKQMARDLLAIKGPMSLGEMVSLLQIEQNDRMELVIMLNDLQDKGQVVLDVDKGVWRS